MRKENIFLLVLVVSLVLVGMLTTARGFAHWEMTKEQFIFARTALDVNIQLLQVAFRWEKKSGASEEWLSARSKTIYELKKELIKIDENISRLLELPFYEKVFFIEKEVAEAKYLATILYIKEQESIARVVSFLGECQNSQEDQ